MSCIKCGFKLSSNSYSKKFCSENCKEVYYKLKDKKNRLKQFSEVDS